MFCESNKMVLKGIFEFKKYFWRVVRQIVDWVMNLYNHAGF